MSESTSLMLAVLGVVNALLLVVVLLVVALRKSGLRAEEFDDATAQFELRLRRELGDTASRSKSEVAHLFSGFAGNLQSSTAEHARTQNQQIDSLSTSLNAGLQALQKSTSDTLTLQLQSLSEANARRLNEVRMTLDAQLTQLQTTTQTKLDDMRKVVDEQLQTTLEKRLSESFKLVADRLEQVHKGLGEMQGLAQGVGDLKRVLTNVKTRGVFGEVQLQALLEQALTQEQFAKNVETVPGSNQRVEFAVRFPGKNDGVPIWLPIDAKFPREDYDRLQQAQERADPVAAEAAGKALELRIRVEAKTITASYVATPHTTEFAILFLPTEGLYAEVLRRPGLVEALQRDHRVSVAGPSTLLAMLNALRMGFNTLAMERQAAQVWEVLGAVKTEFERYGKWIGEVKKSLDLASSKLDDTQTRTRMMYSKLKQVEALPADRALEILPLNGDV